jgi:hypothetical protein
MKNTNKIKKYQIIINKEIKDWDVEDVMFWLKNNLHPNLNLIIKNYEKNWKAEKITGEVLLSLVTSKNEDTSDLESFHQFCIKKLKIEKFGHREKLFWSIVTLENKKKIGKKKIIKENRNKQFEAFRRKESWII